MKSILPVTALCVLAMPVGVANADEPVHGVMQPITGSDWSFVTYETADGKTDMTMVATDGRGATYRLPNCFFADGEDDNGEQDGIRGVYLTGIDQPIVTVTCHVGAHSQAVSIYAPELDYAAPVFGVVGAYYANVGYNRVAVVVDYDVPDENNLDNIGGFREEQAVWPPADAAFLSEPDPTRGYPEAQLLPPMNSNWSDDAVRFVSRLNTIIRDKDLIALRNILGVGILNSFGGNGGVDEFFEMWGLNRNADNSEVWDVLAHIIDLGGVVYEDFTGEEPVQSISFPYTSSNFPNDFDVFEFAIATGPMVPFRAVPSDTGGVMAYLDHEIIRPANGWMPDPEWYLIERFDGSLGWVDADYVLSPIDYRAEFQKIDGEWKMTSLVAGD